MSKYDMVGGGGLTILYIPQDTRYRGQRDICIGKLIFIETFYGTNS